MARFSNFSGHHSRSPYDATLLAADRILAKKSEYEDDIRKVHTTAKMLAQTISAHGDITKSLLDSNENGDIENEGNRKEDEDVASDMEIFFKQQRERLKQICVRNVTNNRNVEYFLKALGSIRDDIRTKQQFESRQRDDGAEETPVDNPPDYRIIIEQKMKEIKHGADNGEIGVESVHEHRFYLEVCERLGEKEKKTKARHSRGGNDEDDELEIIPANESGSVISLKCPITGMLYEDPLKNKVCGHVISKAGFEQMVRTKKRACPVAGCTNRNVTHEQLEEDFEMVTRINRYKKRLQREREAQNQYSDDEDDNENPHMTVIH